MADNLVIVESPAKAKTIEGFLGKDFTVKSSYGHVRDLAKGSNAVDVENNFTPIYEVSDDKKQVISELKKLVKKAKLVWLATDEDREGEAISWHLFETLGLKEESTKRIVFNEITKSAILGAIEKPRKIDQNLVNAQQARRILDRLVGFELSPILWKKIKPSLSAGRVQSVAVRLLVEREREVENFEITSSYKVVAIFDVPSANGNVAKLKADLGKRFKTFDEANAFLDKCNGAEFKIKDLEKKPSKKSPSAPFTTSTMQQEASRKLGYSVGQTMLLAQRLYESGKITYMRTDSVNLSKTALDASKLQITSDFGAEYSNTRQFKTKNSSAQEAHEAIRPTDFDIKGVEGDAKQAKLYELIWKRAIASQMSDAKIERTIAHIEVSTAEETFKATGEVILFDGFLKVYMESTDDEEQEEKSGLLPPLTVGQVLDLEHMSATERFTHPPARYTEASLVKKLEELGIGRPSTYAPTISTIQKRGYVVKEERQGRERVYNVLLLKEGSVSPSKQTEITGADRNKLFPTDIGVVVNDFLVQHFENVLDYNFTATVEKEFDQIAQGLKEWSDMISSFYDPFHKTVEVVEDKAERATGERQLGIHPENGKQVTARIGRYGPIVQMRVDENDDKPQYASLRVGQRLETITLDEAVELFKLPRDLGEHEDKKVVASIGRFGPYIRHDSKFVSIKKDDGDDPYTIELARAIELIEAKRKADLEKIIKLFDENPEVQILKGRWGPYLKFEKKNIRIPKETDPASLTFEDCLQLEKDYVPSRGRKTAVKKAIVKKAVVKKKAVKKATAKKKTAKKATAKKKKS